MKDILFLILILILALGLPLFLKITESMKKMEGYSNFTLEDSIGEIPSSEEDILVQNTYPITGINGISNNGSNNIWWWYPIFKLGSYAQITNNIRYPYRPDNGSCTPASMCGALYNEKKIGSNTIKPIPPINPTCGTRVGYFSTKQNLLPFRSNFQNILY